MWKKSTAAIKTDQAGKPVPFIMYLTSDVTVGIDFFSAPVDKPLACCVNIISRPPSEIFFFLYPQAARFWHCMQTLENLHEKICCMEKKKKERKRKISSICHQYVICWIFPGSNKGYFLTRRSTVLMLKAISGKGHVVYYTVIHNARLLQLVPLNDHKRKQNNLSLKIYYLLD